MVFFRAGTLRLRINLREVEFKESDLLAVSPGTVFEFLYISSDLDLAMLAFSNSLMENWQKEDLLQTYLQGRLFLHLSLTAKEGSAWSSCLPCYGKSYTIGLFRELPCRV